jgi:hypothetical protein
MQASGMLETDSSQAFIRVRCLFGRECFANLLESKRQNAPEAHLCDQRNRLLSAGFEL